MLGLLAAIVAATLVTTWVAWTLNDEQAMLADLVVGKAQTSSDVVRALPAKLRLQHNLTIVILVILIATALGLLTIRRAFLDSRQSLRDVKILAGDILASMDQGVVTTTCDGVITSINRRGRELLGVVSECVGRPISEILPRDLGLDELSHEVLAGCRAVNDRDVSISRNGYTNRLRADCYLLRGTNGDVFGSVLHLRDVTERVLVEERMRRMERHLGLGSLAVGLHHEIKNPLTALSLHVQLLEERLESQSPGQEVDELLRVLKTEVTRLNGVLETFRDFAAFRSLSPQPTDVVGLIDKVVRLVQPQADLQKVRIAVEGSEPPAAPVSLDATKFEQVLLNLIINALEAMSGGGELTIRSRVADEELHMDVVDSGCGIPPAIQPRIFDPYFTTKSDGAGIGLAWSEKIIQQHHGHIEFETGPKGTTFKVTIPVSHDALP